jgi:tRNA pseudouridine38-40 synthase
MRAAAASLVGRHDFAAFGSAPRAGGSTVRNVAAVSIERNEIGTDSGEAVIDTVVITVHADALLRGMMRSFTGALVKIGQGRATPEWLASLIDTATMRDPSVSVAPARGLHQWSVRYDPTPEELAA